MLKRGHFRATQVAIALAALKLIAAYGFDLDIFEVIHGWLSELEAFELDEILLVLLVVGSGIAVDLAIVRARQQKHLEIQEQRLRVLKATMRTVQDIFNNFLQNLQLFTEDARSSKALPPESLKQMDSLIHGTARRLRKLGDLTDTPEIEMGGDVGIRLTETKEPAESR